MSILLKIKKNFVRYLKQNKLYKYWFILRHIDWVIGKYLNVILMIIVFFMNPKKLYKYSWRNCLPPEEMKDPYKDNLYELYELKVLSNFKLERNNRRLYTRGYTKSICYGEDVVLINWKVTKANKHCTFVTSDQNWLDYYLEEKVDVIYIKLVHITNKNIHYALNDPIHKKKNLKMITLFKKTNNENIKHSPLGSAIAAILAYSLVSSSLNVFGFNFYQTKELSNMNILEFIFKVFFFKNDYISKDYVESSLTHLFFSYYFRNMNNLIIEGRLDYFKNRLLDKIFTNRILKIFLY